MQSIADELLMKTQVYWKLSQVRNGKRNIQVETGDAIEICTTMLSRTSFHRPIFHSIDGLLQDIISDEPRRVVSAKILEYRNGSQG